MCANGNRKERTMNEERLAILRMVAEGKITADEAAQLLDALKEAQRRSETAHRASEPTYKYDYKYNYYPEYDRPRGERHRHRDQFDWQSKFTGLASGLAGMFDGLFQQWEDQTLDIPEGSEVTISCTAGNLTVRGTDSGQMRVSTGEEACGPLFLAPRIHVDRERKRVDITSTTHNLTVEIPWQTVALQARVTGGMLHLSDLSASLVLNVAGGHLHVKDITGAIAAKVVGGQADLTDLRSSDLDVNVRGGSVAVTMRTITDGRVTLKTVGGNVVLRLPAASAFDVEADAKPGHIRTNLPITVQAGPFAEELRGTYNGGGATVRLSARAGNVEIDLTESPATEPSAPEHAPTTEATDAE